MSENYIIEVDETAVGLVVGDRGGFRFFSADSAFAGLDGHLFRNPQAAERAAARHRVKGDGHVADRKESTPRRLLASDRSEQSRETFERSHEPSPFTVQHR
jgi:hypothetical protein